MKFGPQLDPSLKVLYSNCISWSLRHLLGTVTTNTHFVKYAHLGGKLTMDHSIKLKLGIVIVGEPMHYFTWSSNRYFLEKLFATIPHTWQTDDIFTKNYNL